MQFYAYLMIVFTRWWVNFLTLSLLDLYLYVHCIYILKTTVLFYKFLIKYYIKIFNCCASRKSCVNFIIIFYEKSKLNFLSNAFHDQWNYFLFRSLCHVIECSNHLFIEHLQCSGLYLHDVQAGACSLLVGCR